MIAIPRCFKVDAADNVATMLDDAEPGAARVIGAAVDDAAAAALVLREAIQLGHKVALTDIPAGEAVVKFGVPIGRASSQIRRGDWVHLHNCESNFDARSGSLDLHSGAATDTKYE
ncbi:MAG TPA: UxaA family hydrolase [Tepidisphaeraceae bacterium]|nr:UxaA family hydrolase [Tepidisphaeraceae bacterium]